MEKIFFVMAIFFAFQLSYGQQKNTTETISSKKPVTVLPSTNNPPEKSIGTSKSSQKAKIVSPVKKATTKNESLSEKVKQIPIVISKEASYEKNIYDNTGKLYNRLLNEYLIKNGQKYTSLRKMVSVSNELCLTDVELQKKYFGESSFLDHLEIGKILTDGRNHYTNIIKNTSLSPFAKERLSFLYYKMQAYNEITTEYQVIYDYIVNFEDSIMTSSRLSSHDQQVVLIATSILRHSLGYWSYKNDTVQDENGIKERWRWIIISVAGSVSAVAGGISEKTAIASAIATSVVVNGMIKDKETE